MDKEAVIINDNEIILEERPGILIIGSPDVGKRTIISRLLTVDFEDVSGSSNDLLSYGWTIDTKYYTADVSLWMAHLHRDFSVRALPMFDRMAALVMVFDLNDLSSFAAHVEYRRHLRRLGESWGSTNPELDYGISETEGSSLLRDEEPFGEIKNTFLEWCSEHNIEYVEVCASNADFDKCLSVDGDSQGVDRLYGALSAHMWPGMILKSENKIIEPSLPGKEELSEDELDYEFDYEILSAGSAEPWDDTYGGWVSSDHNTASVITEEQIDQNPVTKNSDLEMDSRSIVGELQPSTSASDLQEEVDKEDISIANESDNITILDEQGTYEFEDLEKLMSEIGTVRDSLRLMPDFQRREMAAQLAMKMAAMFGNDTDDEM